MVTWADSSARIVVVDDYEANTALLAQVLEGAGYTRVVVTNDSTEAVAICTEEPADLLLLDLHMPDPDGHEVIAQLNEAEVDFPIIVLTADETPEARVRALASGARDFLTKPFDRTEVLLRIGNHLQIQLLQRQLRSDNHRLENEVERRTRALEEAHRETLERLALVAEYRDDDTGEHVRRVGRCAAAIAGVLGLLAEEARLLGDAATLHDVGKVGVPDRILHKPGRLSEAERNEMKLHVALSERILAGGCSELLRMAERIARAHHERWDGTGYPRELRGEEIPLAARITSVADVFDALTHARPYKEAWSIERSVAEIRDGSGTQFDPRVVEAFERLDHAALIGPLDTSGESADRAVADSPRAAGQSQ